MKKFITISLILCFTALLVNTKTNAQTPTYDLKFSRAIIVGSSQQTVPPNTVWKVTSIYGEENQMCIPVPCYSLGRYTFAGKITCMYVNGVFIPSTISGLSESQDSFSNNTCNSGAACCSKVTCANKTADPNILPMWLPANTTLKSGGPNTFVSVIEFVLQ